MSSFNTWVIDAFEKLTPDIDNIYISARLESLESWRIKQQAMVTGSGAAAMAIPGAHLVALGADVMFLMNRMSVCSYGIGAIYSHDRLGTNLLEEEDFANILALWAGDDQIKAVVTGKFGVDLAVKIGGKTGIKIIGKTIAHTGAVLVGKKLGGKAGAKIAAKFAGKLAGKAAGGAIPILGAIIGGGINLWFITSIADAANEYYNFKTNLAGGL